MLISTERLAHVSKKVIYLQKDILDKVNMFLLAASELIVRYDVLIRNNYSIYFPIHISIHIYNLKLVCKGN